MSRISEARNARARALGFESYYAQRIAQGQARGLSRPVARGHAGVRDVGIRASTALERNTSNAVKISAVVANPRGPQPQIQVTTTDAKGKVTVQRFDIRARAKVQAILDAEKMKGVGVEGTP